MRTSDFDFHLPQELIAQQPVERGGSRLLVLDRSTGRITHQGVAGIAEWLREGDLLLINDTRVIAARLEARRPTGRRFEMLLLEPRDGPLWQALLRPSSRARAGEALALADGGAVILQQELGEGQWLLRFDPALGLDRLEELGETPLPPYIQRPHGATAEDREAYQTVYATEPGAVAAPTAGLHFTEEMLQAVARRGVERVSLTLHVGIGTFRPVSVQQVADHHMHSERYHFSSQAAAAVNSAIEAGRRIVCVGTTSVRALEGALAAGQGRVEPGWASTDIFITPGYRFAGVGALLTNFHLPRSTLLMLVSALADREAVLEAYGEAVKLRYRFFSYGDAMLIL